MGDQLSRLGDRSRYPARPNIRPLSRNVILQPPKGYRLHFYLGGWHRWRRARTVTNAVPREHPAFEILQSFSGVHVHPWRKRGITSATSDIAFGHCESVANYGDENDIDKWASVLGTQLVGIAEFGCSHCHLWIAGDNRCFESFIVAEGFFWIANSFDDAFHQLMTGAGQPKPMMRPDQHSIEAFGETLARNDQRLYNWKVHSGPNAPKYPFDSID